MKKENLLITSLIILYSFTLLIILRNLNFQYFWYDEAGQFWISKGLNHYSAPLSPEGNLADVIQNNRDFNKDPGGFSILLYFWMKLSCNMIWLRLLPFLFFIPALYCFCQILFKWTGDKVISLISGFAFIFFPTVLFQAFELRAYSMEMLGTLLCVIMAERFADKITLKSLLIWSCGLALLMTSRYSLIIVCGITGAYVLYMIWASLRPVNQKISYSIAFILPMLVSVLVIAVFVLKYQSPDLEPMLYLQYLKGNLNVLIRPFNLMFVLLLLVLTLLYVFKFRHPVVQKYRHILWLGLITNFAFIGLSIAGLHPWHLGTRGCISMQLLILLAVAGIGTELLKKREFLLIGFKYTGTIAIAVLLVWQMNGFLMIRFQNRNNTYDQLSVLDISKYKRIYVEGWENPCLRHLYEYGKLSGLSSHNYPGSFELGLGMKHKFHSDLDSMNKAEHSMPPMDSMMQYDLIISSTIRRWGNENNSKWINLNNSQNIWIHRPADSFSRP